MNAPCLDSATAHPTKAHASENRSFWKAAVRPAAFVFLFTALSPMVRAQTLIRDTDGQSMQNISDVTNGMTYLLKRDDIAMLTLSQNPGSGAVSTSLATWDMVNSEFTKGQTLPLSSSTPANYTANSSMAQVAPGRMYEIKTDTIAVLNEGDGPHWQLQLINLPTLGPLIPVTSQFQPHDTVHAQAVMGFFLGNQLEQPLLLYSSAVQNGQVQWGMKVFSAGTDLTNTSMWTEGPELYGTAALPGTGLAPLVGTAVTGDFNGDGRDEIAVLMDDYKTVGFYQIDSTNLAIMPMVDANKQPIRVSLGTPFANGIATLTAGRFRNTLNAELVASGQGANGKTTIYSIQTMNNGPYPPCNNSSNEGPFWPCVLQTATLNNSNGLGGVETNLYSAAGPIVSSPNLTYQQIVLGQNYSFNYSIGPTIFISFITIGSFNDSFVFVPQSNSDLDELNGESVRLYGLNLGNFSYSGDPTANPSFGMQLELYMNIQNGGFDADQITTYNLNVPQGLLVPAVPGMPVGQWLGNSTWIQGGQLPDASNQVLGMVIPGDIQGNSLKLGQPTVVRIPKQIQPDLVLGMPPMHIDWIKPIVDLSNANVPGCTDPQTPCLMNLTVLPSTPATNTVPFATKFDRSSSSSTQGAHTNTTSWGISVQDTVDAKASFKGAVFKASADLRLSAGYAYQNNVAARFNHFSTQSQSFNATTGLADYVLFTTKGMNVYYYPVIGQTSCPDDDQSCANPEPTYVEFSVPDAITTLSSSVTTQEWYQPVDEPGEIFSYPWSEDQLEGQFTNPPTLLSPQITQCQLTDGSGTSFHATWESGSGDSVSSGSTNTISTELSFSVSAGAGAKFGGGDISNTFNFKESNSWGSLDENTVSVEASQGITVTKPPFNLASLGCCSYYFGGYIFSMNSAAASAQKICPATGQTQPPGCIPLPEPGGTSPVSIPSTGPLFTGFVADMVPSSGTGACVGSGGTDNWWRQVYNLPDVAVNHPNRYHWDPFADKATFNAADQSFNIPANDQPFYQMKGFFITPEDQSGSGASAVSNTTTATDGDILTLTARIYNYSLKDTNDPTLTDPAKDVKVKFYGQYICKSGSQVETSCRVGNTTCQSEQLCGPGFPIGEATIPYIPGFKSLRYPDKANWTTASVDFDTKDRGGAFIAFWVVTWMEDSNCNLPNGQCNLAPEMPDHGLLFNPDTSAYPPTSILDLPIQAHSNNVGMYGQYAPLYVALPPTPGATPSSGSLQRITLSATPNLLLEQRTKLSATLQAAGGPVDDVNIAYFDGNPDSGGKLLDAQQIQHMEPGVAYAHRAFFVPDRCGSHSLYTSAWIDNQPEIRATATTDVTLDTVNFVQALIDSTQSAGISDPNLKSNLLALLNIALQDFQQSQIDAGNTALSAYMQQLALVNGKGITANSTNQLIGQAGTVLGCGSTGFSLVTSPSTVTVPAGTPASYSLALTPTGGFNGKISLACMGAPRGVDCSLSSQSVTLDGVNQSRVTVTVTTTPGAASAGIAGGALPARSERIRWLVTLLLAALAMASLRRARMRQTILGCVIALALLGSASGCGSNGSTTTTGPGTYAFTLQATSGSTVRNALLVLVVK